VQDIARQTQRAGELPSQRAEQPLLIERRDGIVVLTLNRPETRNSLSEGMLAALQSAVDQVSSDAGVRAAVVTAVGTAFSAGHDLKELTGRRTDPDGGRRFHDQIMRQCSRLMRSIVKCPKPFIAAVQGAATAAGCQLVATCDLAVASQTAKFSTPGVNIGLFCSTPMVALSRNVPRKRAMEMLLLGEMIGAEAAADYGLVNRVVDPGMLMDEAMAMAQAIAAKSSATVAIGKEAFYRQIEMPLVEAYDYASGVMVENMLLCDAEEGIGAFIEKRAPHWKDR
jgi:enoyl-CoA hydratase/carnithine racemase